VRHGPASSVRKRIAKRRAKRAEELAHKEREEREVRERAEKEAKERLEKKDYTKKRSRRSYRPEVTLPNPEMYITSQPSSGLSSPPSTTPPPPAPVLSFPSPPSPIPPPMRFKMHGGNGSRVEDSSDEDKEDDEFEDSEQTEATAPGTDAEESLTSEGELCATPESEPRIMGADDKWVAVKGHQHQHQHQTLLAPPPSPPLSPEAVHA